MLGSFFRFVERFMQLLTVSYVPVALILLVVAIDVYVATKRREVVRHLAWMRAAELIAAITWTLCVCGAIDAQWG